MNQLKRVVWISLKNPSLNESIGPSCYAEFPIMVLGCGGGCGLKECNQSDSSCKEGWGMLCNITFENKAVHEILL